MSSELRKRFEEEEDIAPIVWWKGLQFGEIDYVRWLEIQLEAKGCEGCKYEKETHRIALNECANCNRKGTDNYMRRPEPPEAE